MVARSRRCGGRALSAKRASRDSGIFSSFGLGVSTLPPVLPVCARQLMQASSSKIPSRNARFIVVSLFLQPRKASATRPEHAARREIAESKLRRATEIMVPSEKDSSRDKKDTTAARRPAVLVSGTTGG